MRRVGHRLHAAGHHDLELAGPDELVGQRDRVQPGQADLVDQQRRHAHRDAGLDRGLPRRHLPGAGLQHLPEDHVVDLVAGDAGALQRGLDRDRAEVGAGEVACSAAEQLAHRRPRAAHDHGTRARQASCTRRCASLSRCTGTGRPERPVGLRSRICVFLRIDHVGHRGPRPGRGDRLVRRDVRSGQRARGGQRGPGRPGGDARRRRRHDADPAAGPAAAGLGDRDVPRPARPGLQQVAYTVEDVEAAAETLRGRGLRVLYERPRRGHRRLAGELRAPQGRRRRAGRAGPAGIAPAPSPH